MKPPSPEFFHCLASNAIWKISRISEVLFPRRCPLCGETISPLSSPFGHSKWPLCPNCEGKLHEISGARCERCGKALISEHSVCYTCRTTTHVCQDVYPLYRYEAEVQIAVQAYKRDSLSSLAPFWAEQMAPVLRTRWPGGIMVPVPPRPGKGKRQRWDAVEALARELQRAGFEVRRVLERKSSVQQKFLSKEGRKENALKGYILAEKPHIEVPRRAILLDDVYTTGATIDACASILYKNGSSFVSAIVIAAD